MTLKLNVADGKLYKWISLVLIELQWDWMNKIENCGRTKRTYQSEYEYEEAIKYDWIYCKQSRRKNKMNWTFAIFDNLFTSFNHNHLVLGFMVVSDLSFHWTGIL